MSPRDRGPFFETDWIGRVISLSRTRGDSWKLGEKLGEKYSQAEEPGRRPGGATCPEAWATYICYDILDNDKKSRPQDQNAGGSFLYILLCKRMLAVNFSHRIPYHGTEFNSPESRARHARDDTSRLIKSELRALEQLTREGCCSAPRLLKYKIDKQDYTLLVPGGYIVYILMDRLPGVPLGDFWDRGEAERQEIRDAFKVAYMDCIACGMITLDRGCDNLLWDRGTPCGWHGIWRIQMTMMLRTCLFGSDLEFQKGGVG